MKKTKVQEWKIITRKRNNMLQDILDIHIKYGNSFFWTGTRDTPFTNTLTFTYKGQVYLIQQSMHSSRRNVYYRLNVYIDGKKKSIRDIKKIMRGTE